MGTIIPLLLLPLLLGLALLIRGWRGRRVDDHPLCRRCGYDLVASAQAVNCPECGRDLRGRRARRIGHRQRRKWSLTFGSLMLFIGLGVSGTLMWATASGFDWNTIKPVWLLKRQADGRNRDTAQQA